MNRHWRCESFELKSNPRIISNGEYVQVFLLIRSSSKDSKNLCYFCGCGLFLEVFVEYNNFIGLLGVRVLKPVSAVLVLEFVF